MKIHFVCTHNTYRSRLAEAYLNSKKLTDTEVSSSGTNAKSNFDGSVSWFAQRLLIRQGLVGNEKLTWTQSSPEVFAGLDLVIFMQEMHHKEAAEKFGFDSKNYEVWDVEDLTDEEAENDKLAIQRSEEIFDKIKANIESLISRNFAPKNF